MADNHTPTPWYITRNEFSEFTSFEITDKDGFEIGTMWGGIADHKRIPGSANANHVVECVNACEGLENLQGVRLNSLLGWCRSVIEDYAGWLENSVTSTEEEEELNEINALLKRIEVLNG